MMGRSHSLSGAVGWLAGCAAVAAAGWQPQPVTVVVGAAVSAGFALAPDIDHPSSTVARTLGPVTRLFATVVAAVAGAARRGSCNHCAADMDRGGHRAATHTTVFAAMLGLLVAGLGAWVGERAGLTVIGVAVWLVAHTALSSKWRARIGDMVLPGRFRRMGKAAFRFTSAVGALMVAAVAVVVVAEQTGPAGWWWVGAPVAWGCLAHSMGDALTRSGAPLLWPLRIGGCRWASVGTPMWLRFRTGSGWEQLVVVVLLLVGGLSGWALTG
jgi:membrane-bound metal-dependent hydrolase YbcI (DUF457 family)